MRRFVFRWQFDGDLDALLEGVHEGHAVHVGGMQTPIRNATIQGKRLLLPLPHRTVEIDLTHATKVASEKNPVVLSLEFERR